jgi:enoyl-CoA hydratase/carnithine racemase
MTNFNGIKTPPPPCKDVLISYPAPYVLLVTINREKQMNSLPISACWEMDKLWNWLDDEDSL